MNIYVGNIPHQMNEGDLRDAFTQYGSVISAKLVMDHMTGRSRGFAFVEMSSDEEARTAISQMNGSEYGGRTLTVNEARPREERPRRDNNRPYNR
jgi:RNA recognition motif-containing protein